MSGHEVTTFRRARPRFGGHFIASGVEHVQRHTGLFVHTDYIVEHIFKKADNLIAADAGGIVVVSLSRAVLRCIGGVNESEPVGLFRLSFGHQTLVAQFHGFDSGPRVARQIYFRNNLYVSLLCIAENLFEVAAGIIAVAVRARTAGVRTGAVRRGEVQTVAVQVTAPAANLCQFGQAVNLKTPALVFREVEKQFVELVAGHHIEQAQNGFFRLEISAYIEVKAAIGESGLVSNRYGGNHITASGILFNKR